MKPNRSHSRTSGCLFPRPTALACLLLAVPAFAAEPRFVSLRPTATGGEWRAEVEAKVSLKVVPEETALVAVNLRSEKRAVEFAAGTLVDPSTAFEILAGETTPGPAGGAQWTWELPSFATSIVAQARAEAK